MSEEMEGSAVSEKYLPVKVLVALKNGNMEERSVSVPCSWVDDLAFSGRGFTVTFRLLAAVEKLVNAKGIKGRKKIAVADYAGAIVQVSFGEVSAASLDSHPPFEPPYSGREAEG